MTLGIIELIKLLIRVWLAVNVTKPYRRLHEIDIEMLRLSTAGGESALVQIEALAKEQRVLNKLVGTLHADISNVPPGS